jgi:hypothetical protein
MLYNNSMKKRISYFITSASIALFGVLTPVMVRAQTDTVPPDTTVTTTTETETSTSRKSRIEQYKLKLTAALTAAAKSRITERCVAAQAMVKGRTTANAAITTARERTYTKIVSDLEAVIAGAKAKEADTTTLEANLTALQAKITAFKSANTTYQQALSDLAALDCKADPTAFKAALESARTDQKAVFQAAADIRSYLHDTVKPTLKALKDSLKTTTEEE